MNIQDFTYEFLPELASQFSKGELGLKALVDFNLWTQLFPTPDGADRKNEIYWREINWNAFMLKDGTVFLTYELPNPTAAYQPKFIGIRFDRKDRETKYYILLRPKFYDESWDINVIDFTSKNKAENHNAYFLAKLENTWSLRNFVLEIQERDLLEEDNSISASLGRLYDKLTKGKLILD